MDRPSRRLAILVVMRSRKALGVKSVVSTIRSAFAAINSSRFRSFAMASGNELWGPASGCLRRVSLKRFNKT